MMIADHDLDVPNQAAPAKSGVEWEIAFNNTELNADHSVDAECRKWT